MILGFRTTTSDNSRSTARFSVQKQLVLVVLVSVLAASIGIATLLFFSSKKRLYRDTIRQSAAMVQSASLAFATALAAGDEILLDAYLHELQSRQDLHISEAYVINHAGRVVAHSNLNEYGKTYAVPLALKADNPERLIEVTRKTHEYFRLLDLLQKDGNTIGGLAITFTTAHLWQSLKTEILWLVAATLSILMLCGLGIILYGRKLAIRLRYLQDKALLIGKGEWNEALNAEGSDEVALLAQAFNKMRADLTALRQADLRSQKTIEYLNVDLQRQLAIVQQLKEQLADENAALRAELRSKYVATDIIGSEGSLRRLVDQASQLASLPVTVLITGESGTGKELIARFLHDAGSRKDKPFVAINCAALPHDLIESELFGHKKGTFTGATTDQQGKFETANGGTLFLDEIGELPAASQAKLLRVLQEGEILRLGDNHPIKIDVRVIAATNRDLGQEAGAGRFREDLYYRLRVVELCCPPLRERLADLPVLCQHFIEKYGKSLSKQAVGITPSTLDMLASYSWPGNIRELENAVARAVALSSSKVLSFDDFAFLAVARATAATAYKNSKGTSSFRSLLQLCGLPGEELSGIGLDGVLAVCERICLAELVKKTRNQKEAATLLNISPSKMHRLLRKHGLQHSSSKQTANSKNEMQGFQN